MNTDYSTVRLNNSKKRYYVTTNNINQTWEIDLEVCGFPRRFTTFLADYFMREKVTIFTIQRSWYTGIPTENVLLNLKHFI